MKINYTNNHETNKSISSESGEGLKRQLGLFDATMIMVGIVIGSGIFLTTGIMAESLPSAGLILLAWLVGGLLTLCGALIFAELGAAMPEAGGQYVYLREAYGPLPAFLYGWITFLVYQCGSVAGLSVAFSEYAGVFFPSLSPDNIFFSIGAFSLSSRQLLAVCMIAALSLLNYLGVFVGKMIQNTFTTVKIATIAIFVVLGLAVAKGREVDFSLNPSGVDFGQLLVGFGVALVAVSWTFDGWNNLNFVAGEIRNPKRNLPIALVMGTVVISVLYFLVNLVYFRAFSVGEMVGVVTIAESAGSALFGKTTSGILSAAVLISVFGALNGTIFVGPRVFYAMAKDKLFFKRVASVHPRFHTPSFAIAIQAIWASVLALTGTFEQLFTYVIFVAIIFWIAAAASVFTLRKKFPNLHRPYKVWGYPVVPIVFIVASVGILANTLMESPVESLTGLGFLALGVPVYLYWKNQKK